MNKVTLVVALILCAVVALGEGAVIIRKPSDGKPAAASSITRVISVLPSGDKYPKKRDSPALATKEDVPLVEGNKDRSTFSVNKRRPCTFCKFFTTVTPAPKAKMYFKFVQPWIGWASFAKGPSVLFPVECQFRTAFIAAKMSRVT